MYNILVTSNSINKMYYNINNVDKCYSLIVDTYKAFKLCNDDTFSIVLHDKERIVIRINNKHCITRDSIHNKYLIYN